MCFPLEVNHEAGIVEQLRDICLDQAANYISKIGLVPKDGKRMKRPLENVKCTVLVEESNKDTDAQGQDGGNYKDY